MNNEKKNHYIELFRNHKFNCFPIPENTKVADFRYKASKTVPNQIIKAEENYGVLPTAGSGNCLIDYDSKEEYRQFAELLIQERYMVIESPHGWHIPVVGLTGQVGKIELFNYKIQNTKIVEVQGFDHYCVGVESVIVDKDDKELSYINRGSDRIWDLKGKDFHAFVDILCKQVNVESRKKQSNSSYKNFRDKFLAGEIPTKGQSNDYFHQAAIQCNTNSLSLQEARDKIKIVYHKWSTSDQYSNRPWSNIEAKIQEVYDNNQVVKTGRPENADEEKTVNIARKIVDARKIYSNVDTDEIFENKDGFLELINNTLVREMLRLHPDMTQTEYNDVLFKLKGYADEIPQTNKDFIVFKNGVFDKIKCSLTETDELADMGFREYNYLPKGVENEPTQFMKVLFDDTPTHEIPRIKAGLRSIFINYLDPKISVLYGASGVGKSTPLLILVGVLGNQYALSVELNQFLEDKFIRAKIMGMRLLVFQDLPKEWKDFTTLKTLTGEQRKTERGFMKDSITFDNKLKIWASGNYLAKIPEHEQDAMYTRRLSLIHNTRSTPHKEDPTFADKIIKEESEKIVSWIVNFTDEECQYEDKKTVQEEWEETASPEISYLNKFWQLSDERGEKSVMKIVKDFQEKYQQRISIEQMAKSLKGLGYAVKNNIIANIEEKPVKSDKLENEKLV
jgi:energy-coupling factor transporter ATP-binding protein EcfA2